MPRKALIRTSEYPYHITTRSNNRDWFNIPLADIWIFCSELLTQGEKKFNIKIEAFVLMSNHYHLCVYTPEANIDQFMRFFNQHLGRKIAKKSCRINRIFGAPYKWTLITGQAYFNNVIRYVYQNPLRAGICTHCEEYPYSDFNYREFTIEYRNWINNPLCEYDANQTKKGLRQFEI